MQTDEGGGTSGRSSRGSDDDKLDRFLRSRLQRPPKTTSSGDSAHSMSPGFCKLISTFYLLLFRIHLYVYNNNLKKSWFSHI